MTFDAQTRYVHGNTNYLFSQIKRNLKDCEFGKMTREQLAVTLRSLADKVEAKETIHPELFNDDPRYEHLTKNWSHRNA